MATTAITVHSESSAEPEKVETSPTPAPTVCPVCFQRFNPARDRVPCVLHCEHVVCLTCVKMLWLREPLCPVCREAFAPDVVRTLECVACAADFTPDMYQTRCCSNRICQRCALARFAFRNYMSARGAHRAQLCFVCPGEGCTRPVLKAHVHRIQL